MTRYAFIIAALVAVGGAVVAIEARAAEPVPVIDITDLYHPHQDPGDNFDLVAAYALPEIDLKAVVFDITAKFREPEAFLPEYNMHDKDGPREPGIVPVSQLNYIFGRNVPMGVALFERMKSPDDKMLDAPRFQQAGIELLLATLAASPQPVEIVSFGSARPLAVAFNRNPDLLRAKVRRIHLSAGSCPKGCLEWNVMLDRQAIVRLLRSDLPIAIYPCATDKGPFDVGTNNTFWSLPDLSCVRRFHPRVQSYLTFAFARSARVDFLRAMDEPAPEDVLNKLDKRKHSVWETAIWIQVANRRLVRRADGACRILPADEVKPTDTVLPNDLRPCRVEVEDNGEFTVTMADTPSNLSIYDRGDAKANEAALREALPALYESFTPPPKPASMPHP